MKLDVKLCFRNGLWMVREIRILVMLMVSKLIAAPASCIFEYEIQLEPPPPSLLYFNFSEEQRK